MRIFSGTNVAAVCLLLASALFGPAAAADDETLRPLTAKDVFELQHASDPQISPDGSRVVYERAVNDIMTDRTRRNLWIIDADGTNHRPLYSGPDDYTSPRWSHDGERLAYVADVEDRPQLLVRWMDSGDTAVISNLTHTPSSLAWSPDGEWLAFTMHVPADEPSLASPPQRPEGAEWAEPATVIDSVVYRWDGQGYLEPGYTHVFIVPARGGTARQLTEGDYDHAGPLAWTPGSERILFTSSREDGWEYVHRTETDIFSVDIRSGEIGQLTDLPGVARAPAVSPDGRRVAFQRGDHQGAQYWLTDVAVMNADGSSVDILTGDLDRRASEPTWGADSRGVYFTFDDRGERKVGYSRLDGRQRVAAEGLGGEATGRPYLSGGFSVARDGTLAYTAGNEQRPADVHLRRPNGRTHQLTALNEALLAHRDLGEVHEITYESSVDGTEIHGWYVTPPGFDPSQRYPLILEIHGGPHLAYGPHFAAEIQRYAAEGYVVFYNNYRGSSSYGRDFAMLLEYKYSSPDDFGDHMSGIDAMIELGFVDPERLFITGGSAGGIATAYAIGLTDRFRAAAAVNPVINWVSKVLTGDTYTQQIAHQFPGMPWEAHEHYWERSPLSLVGNVATPTVLITGENDFRTPISETEQYYQALKLMRVDTAMVRLPGTSHNISGRPSRMIAKTDNVLAWFERYDKHEEARE